MATTTNQRTDSASSSIRQGSESSQPAPKSVSGVMIFGGIITVGILGAGLMFMPQLYGLTSSKATRGALTHTVKQGGFMITIKEDGNVESAQNEEVKCQIAGGATILWIVEDGKIVEKGEELVRLDSSQLEDQLNSQTIVYEKANATKIQTEEDYETAVISVKEYKDGTYLKELQDAEANIIIAIQNLSTSENLLKHTTRMARKGFATQLQLEADQFGVKRAHLELESAKLAKKTLTEFTYAKTLKSLEAARDAAAARKRSELAAFNLEKVRKDRLEAQLKFCIVVAPQSGMVVYANSTSRRSTPAPQIEEGSMVREGQDLIRLPDLTKMQVKVAVHETKVNLLRTGMLARIVIQDKEFEGSVVSIANQPEPGSWMNSSIKEYATVVAIDGATEGLKPGMTAEVEILISDLKNVLLVPVAAVVEQRGKFYSWVETEKGPDRRLLDIGQTNDQDIEIKDGLKIGDVVLLNPRAVVPAARERDLDREDSSSRKNFGNGKAGKGKGGSGEGYSGDGPGKGTKKSGKRGGKGKGRGSLMQFDKDGDGKVSKDELPAQMQSRFGGMDTNADGFIDRGEASAASARFKNGGGKGRPGGSGGGRPE